MGRYCYHHLVVVDARTLLLRHRNNCFPFLSRPLKMLLCHPIASEQMKNWSAEFGVPQAELLQRNPLDLGQLLLGQLVLEAVAGEEVEADARCHAASAALPLQRVGPGHP